MSRLIDADKLKDAVYESFAPYQMEWARTINQIQKVIDEQQPVEAAPVVHGEWIGGTWYKECSVCSEVFAHTTTLPNFCPRCGADMRTSAE